MWLCYAIALVPVAAGAVFWVCSRKVVWWEWLGSGMLGFAVAVLFNVLSVAAMTADQETWSGQVTGVTYYPPWTAEWDTTTTTTDSKGHTHTTTTHHVQHHSESWGAEDTLGAVDVDKATYDDFRVRLGAKTQKVWVWKCNYSYGDHNVYPTSNTTGVCIPVQAWRSFENRVKAAPSLFSFAKVPKDVPVFEYPANSNRYASDRLRGTACAVPLLEWDKLNARLGPTKKVNLIAVGFHGKDSTLGQWQQAKWIGGRKNDLVICFDESAKPTWVYVFGWTEQDIVKRNLETLILQKGFDSKVLPEIEKEVRASYVIKDWKKFSYITVEPAGWMWWTLVIVMVLFQGGYWTWAFMNEEGKETVARRLHARVWGITS